LTSLPINVPMGIAAFPHELLPQVESILRAAYGSIVHYTLMTEGGHLAAMEQPKLLAEDILRFVELVEETTT